MNTLVAVGGALTATAVTAAVAYAAYNAYEANTLAIPSTAPAGASTGVPAPGSAPRKFLQTGGLADRGYQIATTGRFSVNSRGLPPAASDPYPNPNPGRNGVPAITQGGPVTQYELTRPLGGYGPPRRIEGASWNAWPSPLPAYGPAPWWGAASVSDLLSNPIIQAFDKQLAVLQANKIGWGKKGHKEWKATYDALVAQRSAAISAMGGNPTDAPPPATSTTAGDILASAQPDNTKAIVLVVGGVGLAGALAALAYVVWQRR